MTTDLESSMKNLDIGRPPGFIEELHHEEALFDPPLYKQRYLAVAKLINENASKYVVDMGCAECKFLSLVKDLCPAVEYLTGVDLDGDLLGRKKGSLKPGASEFILKRERPLQLRVYSGSIVTKATCLRDIDFYSCIEVIEHLESDILKEVPETIFGFLRPKIVAITTPNSEYNVLFENFSGMRHWDHKFEWTRQEFNKWCKLIETKYNYSVEFTGIGDPPLERNDVGFCSQMAIFRLNSPCKELEQRVDDNSNFDGSNFRLIIEVRYPHEEINTNKSQKFLDEVDYILNHFYRVELLKTIDEYDIDQLHGTDNIISQSVNVRDLLSYPGIKKINLEKELSLSLLNDNYELVNDDTVLLCKTSLSEFARDKYAPSDISDEELDSIYQNENEELDSIYRHEIECDGFDEDETWD